MIKTLIKLWIWGEVFVIPTGFIIGLVFHYFLGLMWILGGFTLIMVKAIKVAENLEKNGYYKK